ncbi:MAG: Uncharacterized protein XD51_1131 [Moorella sp. 60_41]|nr:MAG: Uncharacterized protein XD51_1131 [Moorella sp. 60_41]
MFHTLRWRQDRIAHIEQKHGVTQEEVEEAVFNDPYAILLRGPRSESRHDSYIYYLLGRTTGGRYLTVVLLDLGGGAALPVTARDMSQKERRQYKRRRK